MVALSLSRFILSLSIRPFPLGGQAKMGEKLQGSIDRRIADLGIHLGHLGIDLTQILMSRGLEKNLENLFPLFGGFQTFSGSPHLEEILFEGRRHF
jgi:hypothetical protein